MSFIGCSHLAGMLEKALCRLLKKIQRRGARQIDERRRTRRMSQRGDRAQRSLWVFFSSLLNRPTVLRKIDRIAVRIVNPKFSLAIRRALVDARRGVELVARLAQRFDILYFEAEVIDSCFQLLTFDLALRTDGDDSEIDVTIG